MCTPASQYRAPKIRNMERDSRGYQKTWQQWPRNHRVCTSPEFSPLLASGSPFLFSPPWFLLNCANNCNSKKGSEGPRGHPDPITLTHHVASISLLFFFFSSSPGPHRYLSPQIALLPDYPVIVSFPPWVKHFLTLRVINFLVLLCLPLKVFAHKLHNYC